jgi:UrcA family protein
MYTKIVGTSARPLLGAVAIACTLFADIAVARDQMVTIAIHVGTLGLDLHRPTDAQTFYVRLRQAAQVACTHGNRLNLVPPDDPKGCYEKALGNAIRSANVPILTQIYLGTHTLQQAAASGINFPVQTAAK